MKKPIAWHRECLQNATDTLARAEAALAEQQVSVSRIKTSVELSIRQLAEAERLGITEFDPDTFLVPRKPRIKEMIPEAIKVAVAEYDGWVPNDMGYWHRNGEVAGLVAQCCDDCDDIGSSCTPALPDYTSDLNAIASVIARLDTAMQARYRVQLRLVTGNPIDATAIERCEAVLRAVGKWRVRE